MYSSEDTRRLAYGFDQHAAAVLVARQGVYNTNQMESMDVIRWLDRNLIKLAKKFTEY